MYICVYVLSQTLHKASNFNIFLQAMVDQFYGYAHLLSVKLSINSNSSIVLKNDSHIMHKRPHPHSNRQE